MFRRGNRQRFTGNKTFKLKGERVSYANIRGKTFQAEGNSSWEAWEIQACLQCLKKNLNETWRAVWPKQGEGGR